jgi:hypothetical protein
VPFRSSRKTSPAGSPPQRGITYFHILPLVIAILSTFASNAFPALAAGWQPEVRLTNDPATSFAAPNNAKWLAVDLNGNLHVVWLDDRDRNFEIYHKMRIGGIWTSDERVTNDPAYSARPNLAVDASGFVHLAWNDERDGNKEIYHNMWAGVWDADRRVTQTAGESFGSALVAEADTIHMVYMEQDASGNLQIMYRAFKNNKWTAAVPLTDVASGNRMVPTMGIGPGGTLHVAWWDTRQDTLIGKIYHRERSGGVWLAEELLTDPANNAMRPSIAVDDSGFVHVAWIDKRGSYEQIYYRRRGPSGWEDEIALTFDDATHYHPSIAVAGGEAVLAYWQNVDATNSEIFFRRRVAGTWTGPVRISNAEGTSELPCLIAGPNRNLHLAWVDSRDGNQEIYYREYIDPTNGTGGGDADPPPIPDIGFTITSSPNPFNASTTVVLSVPDACAASIRIYDVNGRCVRSLLSRSVPRGRLAVVWNGTDGAGRALAPGVYFAVARAGKMRIERKILLLR